MRTKTWVLWVAGFSLLTLFGCGGYATAQSADAQIQFGVEMARRGLWSEALFRFQQAERLEPGSFRVYNNLAVAYEANGRFDQALDYYQRALQAAPGNRELRRNYSRFVEFYQSFKPRAEEAGAAGGSPAEPAAEPEAPEAAPAGEPPDAEPDAPSGGAAAPGPDGGAARRHSD